MHKQILHIGMGKCLSTSLQNIWKNSSNYELLPLTGVSNKLAEIITTHQDNIDLLLAKIDKMNVSLPKFDNSKVQALSCEGGATWRPVDPLLSDFIMLKQKAHAKFFGPHSEKVLLIVRNPRDWIISAHAQYIKEGGSKNLNQYVISHKKVIMYNLNLKYIIECYEAYNCKVVLLPLELATHSEENFWSEYEARLGVTRPNPCKFPNNSINANKTKYDTLRTHAHLNEILIILEDICCKNEFSNKKSTIAALEYARKWGVRRGLTFADDNALQSISQILTLDTHQDTLGLHFDNNFCENLEKNFLEILEDRFYFPYSDILDSYKKSVLSLGVPQSGGPV